MVKLARSRYRINVILVDDLDRVDEEFVRRFHESVKDRSERLTVYGTVEECEWTSRYYCLYAYYYYVFCKGKERCKLAEVYEKDCESDWDSWSNIVVKFPGEYDDSHSIPPWILAAGVAASRIAYREKGWCRRDPGLG